MTTRAQLNELHQAIAAASAYVDLGSVDVVEAVNLTCDYQGIPDDRDRRVVRKAVERRIKLAAGGSVPRRRRVG